MSDSDYEHDRLHLSRRNYIPESPFHRARLNTYSRPRHDHSPPRLANLPTRNRTRSHGTFGGTRTLRGAFATASRTARAMNGQADEPLLGFHATSSASPRRKRERDLTPVPPVSGISESPSRLVETYNGASTLADLVAQQDSLHETGEYGRTWLSSNHSTRKHPDDASLLEDTEVPGYDTHRRRQSDYAKDEQRLKRVTSSRSPVFSKAKVGIKASLAAGNLQRRDNDLAHDTSEDDHDPEPSFNPPRDWGNRARNRDMLSSVNRRDQPQSQEDQPADTADFKFEYERDPNSGLLPEPERCVRQKDTVKRDISERITHPNGHVEQLSPKQAQQWISEHVNSTNHQQTPALNKSSPSKNDTRDLLRKLARTESPAQVKTSQPQEAPPWQIYAKTPVVTGAWIDTPVTERVAGLSDPPDKNDTMLEEPTKEGDVLSEPEKTERSREGEEARPDLQAKRPENKPSDDRDTQRSEEKKSEEPKQSSRKQEVIKPNLPKSALETIIADAKSDRDSLDIGDDTLESLQFLLDEPNSGPKTGAEDEAMYEKAVLSTLDSAAFKTKEPIDIDERLQFLARDVKEVRRALSHFGQALNGFEDKVSRDGVTPPRSAVESPSLGSGINAAKCGIHNSSASSSYTFIRLPSLWNRDFYSQRLHPTRLGWLVLLSATWFFSESTMCDYYCHPFVADICDGNCLDPNAPRFPFVIPTMLWRWSRLSTILSPVLTMLLAFSRLAAQLLGFWDGFVDEPQRLPRLSGEIRIHGSLVTDFPLLATSTTPLAVTPGASPWRSRGGGHGVVADSDRGMPKEVVDDEFSFSMDDDEYVYV